MSWDCFQLDDVCGITMGQAPVGSSYNKEGIGHALIAGAGDFGEETPNPKKHTTIASKISDVSDLILCVRATIGDLNWSDKQYCLGRGVGAATPPRSLAKGRNTNATKVGQGSDLPRLIRLNFVGDSTVSTIYE